MTSNGGGMAGSSPGGTYSLYLSAPEAHANRCSRNSPSSPAPRSGARRLSRISLVASTVGASVPGCTASSARSWTTSKVASMKSFAGAGVPAGACVCSPRWMACVAARRSPPRMRFMASCIVRFRSCIVGLLSVDSFGQRSLDGRAGVECAEHGNRLDRLQCQRRRNVVGNADESQYVDAQPRSRFPGRFEIAPRELLQTQHECAPSNRLAQRIGMGGELIADGSANQVRPVRVEALLDKQVDLAEIDSAKIDGDLFAVGGPRLVGDVGVFFHLGAILPPSSGMVKHRGKVAFRRD